MKSSTTNRTNILKKIYFILTSFTTRTVIIYSILFLMSFVFLIFSNHKIVLGLINIFFLLITIQILFIKKKCYAFFLTRAIIFILVLFELFFGILNSRKQIGDLKSDWQFLKTDNYTYESPELGFAFMPNSKNKRSIEIFNGDTIYDVRYSSNKYGCRVDEAELNNNQDKLDAFINKHAIFLGCSYTFGTGLNYRSTLPYLFELNNPEFESYNYAFPGYAPHQICLQFDEGINTINNTSVPQDSGICIYIFIDDHLNRVYGGSHYLSYGGTTPDIYIKDQKLIIKNDQN